MYKRQIYNWSRAYGWLLANCGRWGFENNYSPEGWHYQHLSDTSVAPLIAAIPGLAQTESEHPMFWLRQNSTGRVELFGHPTEGHKHATSTDELGLLNTLLSGVDSLSTIPVPPRGGAGVFGVDDNLWNLAIEWFGQPVR